MLIQIVDDNPNMRDTIKAVLSGSGAEFLEADDGDVAVKQYSARPADLVLMDIRLKEVDGISATRAILAHTPAARVVMLTQYDDHDLRVAAHEAGAIGYVLKDNLHHLWKYVRHP
jgi:DNA-binding NarL/FixJ family response regulator